MTKDPVKRAASNARFRDKNRTRLRVVWRDAKRKKHSLYRTWLNMRFRCNSPKSKDYKDYGARGITVCERWNSFDSFASDMGERPQGKTLDRIDNNKGYCPENCKWSTRKEQAANKRNTWRSQAKEWRVCSMRKHHGMNGKQIAGFLGVSQSLISSILRSNGIRRKTRKEAA